MYYASTTDGGTTFAFPNVCNTPSPSGTITIPYTSIGDVSDADDDTCAEDVTIDNKAVCTTNTEISSTSSDEAGTSGGVISGDNSELCVWESGSSVVNVEGDEAVRFLDPVASNGDSANAYGAQIAPSQTVVIIN